MTKTLSAFTLNTPCCINCKYFKDGIRDTCTLLEEKDNIVVPYSTCKEFKKHD